MSHVQPEDLFLLHQEESGITFSNPTESFGKSTDRILEDLMKVPSRPVEIEKQLLTLFELIERKELNSAKKLASRLREKIKADPDLLRAELLIQRKEVIGR